MMKFIDGAVVGAALIASAAYALAALGPSAVRRSMLRALARWAAKAPGVLGAPLARRLHAAAEKAGRGCAGCARSDAAPSGERPPASEVRVPLATLRKRSES